MQVVEILVGKFLETLMPDGLEKFIELEGSEYKYAAVRISSKI